MDPLISDETSPAGKYYAAGMWRDLAYPITVFVQAVMAGRGLTRGQLGSALQYRNVAKTLRHLDSLVEGREVPPDFLRRFVVVLDIDGKQLDAAIEATRAVQQAEARRRKEAEIAAACAAFRPHLRVIPERRVPQPIFVAAFTGTARWLQEPIADRILTMPVAQQLAEVGALARAHYSKMDGRAGPFGVIEGYLFRTEFEKAIRLDVKGKVQGGHIGRLPEGRAYLTI